jgi:hypothetical protein
MSFGYDVTMLTWNGTGPTNWTTTHMWHGEGKVRKGIIDDVDPTHDGNELVVVDKSGNCTMLMGSGTTWNATTLWTDPGTPGLARIAVGDADPTYSGKELVVGGDSNNVGIIRRTGSGWEGRVIFTDSNKIRGVGIGDLDPKHSGNEIFVFGYSNKVTMLTGSGNNWESQVVFIDAGRAHDLAVGEFDPEHEGLELVIGGYSNNVTMIMNSELVEAQDFSIYGYPTEQTINSGGTVEFTIGVIGLGGFSDRVHFTLEGGSPGLSSTFYPISVIPDSSTTLYITAPITSTSSDLDLTVKATSGELSNELQLKLHIIGDTEPPSIESTIPSNDAEDIPPFTPIVIKFSEPMNEATLTDASITIIEDESGTEYTGTFQYDDESNILIISDIYEITPISVTQPLGLPNAKLIKVTLDTTITDLAGNNFATDYQFKFLTASDTTPGTGSLEIKSVYPAQDSVGIPINAPIIVEFNIPVDGLTLTMDNIEITSEGGEKYTGQINYDQETLIMTITELGPATDTGSGFEDDSKITVTLGTGIKTVANEPLSQPFSWSFETGKPTETDEDEEEDEFEQERMYYTLGIIILIIVLIITLFACASRSKSAPEKTKEPEETRTTKPIKDKGKIKSPSRRTTKKMDDRFKMPAKRK